MTDSLHDCTCSRLTSLPRLIVGWFNCPGRDSLQLQFCQSLEMSLFLVAVLIASHHECVLSYKPLLPKVLGTKLEGLRSQLSKTGKALGSIVIAATLLNIPMNIEQASAVDRYNNKLNAPTASGTRVNSDAESLLRYGKALLFFFCPVFLTMVSTTSFLLPISKCAPAVFSMMFLLNSEDS